MSGAEIKEARERRQMTQQDLAELVGVSLRTVGSWERGESVPRSRMGALHAALGMNWEDEKFNKDELGARIREQLALNGWSVAEAARRSESIDLRTMHNWVSGTNRPLRKVHPVLEKVLGWEPGSVQRILEAPITNVPSLAEVRDWSKVEGGSRLTQVRPAQIPTSDLLMELGARFIEQQKRIEELESELSSADSSVVSTPAQVIDKDSNVRHLYGLAAHNTDAGRNTEHLDNTDD
jgi:transcriptional regulator with XRE-family HTH domain